MVHKIISGAVNGVEGLIVIVEVDMGPGLPGTDIVGLPDSAVKESRERVRTALKNTGFRLPTKRVTINLAPASTRKEGAAFDLPMAVGILCGLEAIPPNRVKGVFITGELSLDGGIRPVGGVLSMLDNAYKNKITHAIVPFENAREAALVKGMKVAPVKNLGDLAEFFNTGKLPEYDAGPEPLETEEAFAALDFSDVKGQEYVKRAMEVAASGAHNVMMVGPPGSGKTMLARRIPTILDDLTFQESLEVTKIYSVAGLTKNNESLIIKRPFRAPHHTVSGAAMAGGGKYPSPGEISLAHNGVLFLDEFPEFHKDVRESLRQPLEDGFVSISRTSGKITYPSRFMLICAMNPCPCGYYGEERCTCTPGEVSGYQEKVSGPLMDRIDIHVDVPRVEYDKLRSGKAPDTSADIRKRVLRTLDIQRKRYEGLGILTNAQLTEPLIERFCKIDEGSAAMLKNAYEVMSMSARSYHKILKIARTIADMAGCEDITERHLAEAIQYRGLDRRYEA